MMQVLMWFLSVMRYSESWALMCLMPKKKTMWCQTRLGGLLVSSWTFAWRWCIFGSAFKPEQHKCEVPRLCACNEKIHPQLMTHWCYCCLLNFGLFLNAQTDDDSPLVCPGAARSCLAYKLWRFKDTLRALSSSSRSYRWMRQRHRAIKGHGGTEGRVFLVWDACVAATSGIWCIVSCNARWTKKRKETNHLSSSIRKEKGGGSEWW